MNKILLRETQINGEKYIIVMGVLLSIIEARDLADELKQMIFAITGIRY